jgi:peroxiredoxin
MLLFLLAPAAFIVQLLVLKQLWKPWYVPILMTAGVLLMAVSAWQRRGFLRIGGLVLFLLVCAGEWYLVLFATRTEPYTGPAQPGHKIPAFATTLADGKELTNQDLEKGGRTALFFYRGHWCGICQIELGELERQHAEFEKRNVRLYVISNDDQATAGQTQADYPHLVVVSDEGQTLAKAIEVIHSGVGPGGGDTNVPTTFLVDGDGKVRWYFRSDSFLVRQSPGELLAAIDETWPRK